MDMVDITLNIVMFVTTIVLVSYGIIGGLTLTELGINIAYFGSLILYLVKANFFVELK